MEKHGRSLNMGPRVRTTVRLVARIVNPLVLLAAGHRWMPVVGVLRHRGRITGRIYATPLGMRPMGDGFVIPRTFGDHAAWYRNIVAAGGCQVMYLGRTYTLSGAHVVDYAHAAAAFPRYERLQFRILGIAEFLVLGDGGSHQPSSAGVAAARA